MAIKGAPARSGATWYLREWMSARSLSGRGAQARMMELTGWSRATMSQLYNFDQDFNPKLLAEAAEALNAEPFELLMPPERAMAYRQLRSNAAAIVKVEPAAATRTGTEG